MPRGHCRACGRLFEVSPPFAPAYVHYTDPLAHFVCDLGRGMTITDVADLTCLSWDTVKTIVKARLQKA